MSFDVFVERVVDRSPQGVARASAAIASKFGLPAAAIEQRIVAGRFRVKSGATREQAMQLYQLLTQLGAVCSVRDTATGAEMSLGTADTMLASAAPPPMGLAAAGAVPGAPAQSSSPLAGAASPPAARPADVATGLAAAADPGQQDLGVLAGDSGGYRLASLDGEDGGSPPLALDRSDPVAATAAADVAPASMDDSQFAPPEAEGMQAESLALDTSFAPQARKPPSVDVSLPPPELDPPAGVAAQPPDAAVAVAVAVAGAPPQVPAAGAPPPAAAPPSPAMAGQPAAGASMPAALPPPIAPAAARESFVEKVRRSILQSSRGHFAFGVLAAVLVSLIPAHLYSASRVTSAFTDSRVELRQSYAEANTEDSWNGLDELRANALEVMESDRLNIAITTGVIWAVLAGVLMFCWFRFVPLQAAIPRRS